jgi:hypothetical protein
MGNRGNTREVVGELISFAELVRAGKNGLTETLREHDDDQAGDECEVYGSAALQTKCLPGADRMFVDLAGERVVIGQRETRWQIAVESGETVLRALGAGSPAYIKLRPDGSVLVSGTNIALGSDSASMHAALAELVATAVNLQIVNHTHGSPGTPGAPVTPMLASDVASSTVRST